MSPLSSAAERPAGAVDLTDARAPRVKRVRALAGRSVRGRQGKFLIEGPQSVRAVLTHQPGIVVQVFHTPQAAERHPDIAERARQVAARSTTTASEQVLHAMSPDAQGVLVVARIEPVPVEEALEAPLVAFLHQVRDPGNAGTVIRAADAAGAGGVVLSEASVELHNPKTVRSSAGSMFHLPVATGADLAGTIERARNAGMQVLAADGEGQVELDDLAVAAGTGDLSRPTLWVFGNEAHGLTARERAVADAVVRIGIRGHAESLNLAMAATLCLFASARAQRRR
ncbi:TrmH family RNA methyltransferase [Pseudactinotalea sp. Z1748]|uniref:TrmH family RNA methyltransferase n=1 Tax=Pseudactinotalea sp. Z1748 TaxID=3413027 RepID=UPI003C7A96BB